MDQPASADALDANAFEDEFSESSDGADGADGASFDSDGFEGEASAGDEDFAGDAMGGGDDWDAAAGEDLMAASDQDGFDADWQAFEAEVADALDEDEADAFLGRV